MPLPLFENEAEFRIAWVAPFLSKMGYILPKHVHGPNEQGKDFYFAEHDRFGHLRFLAAQVKVGNIGAGSVELDNLLNQVRRSFTVTLKHHKGAENQRISAVYIMASGSISAGAREYISDAIRQEHYGENVYYLDGETLYNLDRHANYLEDKELRQRLAALVIEIGTNLNLIGLARRSFLEGPPTFYACRMIALEDALRFNIIDDARNLQLAWSNLTEINRRCDRILPPVQFLLDAVEPPLTDLFSKAVEQIRKLDKRYSLEVVVEG